MAIPNYNLMDLHERLEQLERVVKELAHMERDLLSPQTAKWLDGQHVSPDIQVSPVQTKSGVIDGVPKSRRMAQLDELPGRPMIELDPLFDRAMQSFEKMFYHDDVLVIDKDGVARPYCDPPHEPTMREIIKMERGE